MVVVATLCVAYCFYIFGSHLARVRSPIRLRSPPRIKLLHNLQAARFSFHTNRTASDQDVVATTRQITNTGATPTYSHQGDMLPLPLPDETSSHLVTDIMSSPAALGISRRPLRKNDNPRQQRSSSWIWAFVHLCAILYFVAGGLVTAFVPVLREWAVVLLFAPVGTVVRWIVSWHLNWYPNMGGQSSPYKLRRVFRIPFGTLLINVVGAAVLAMIDGLNASNGRSIVLVGIGEGLLGCMTTVSTLITELVALPRPSQKYTYFIVSWLSSWLLMFLARL